MLVFSWNIFWKWKVLFVQWCPTLCSPVDYGPGKNSVVVSCSLLQGSFQLRDQTQVSHFAGWFFTIWVTRKAPRILRWVAISFSRRSCQPKDPILVPCIADRFFTIWVTRDIFWLFLNQSLELPRRLSAKESIWQCRRCKFNPVQYYESPSIVLQTLYQI